MNCEELIQLKAKLLCYGVKANKNTKMFMKEVNPYVLDKGMCRHEIKSYSICHLRMGTGGNGI